MHCQGGDSDQAALRAMVHVLVSVAARHLAFGQKWPALRNQAFPSVEDKRVQYPRGGLRHVLDYSICLLFADSKQVTNLCLAVSGERDRNHGLVQRGHSRRRLRLLQCSNRLPPQHWMQLRCDALLCRCELNPVLSRPVAASPAARLASCCSSSADTNAFSHQTVFAMRAG